MTRSRTKSAAKSALMPPLSLALPIQLLRARESVMAWFRPHLRSFDLTDHQWRVLRALAESEELEMQELSTVCEVHPPSLSRIIPRMVELDYVSRANDPADQRRILVRLTASGRKLVDEVSEGSVDIYRCLLQAVGKQHLDDLQSNLAELINKLDHARLGLENEQTKLHEITLVKPRL